MQLIILIMHVFFAVCLVGLVLLQHGGGTDTTSSAFGAGISSNTMFGSTGMSSFLVKVTVILAAAFFCTSIGLSYMASRHVSTGNKRSSVILLPGNNKTGNL
ncbi:preprotein translocase subunit SecG [Coxiella endosymbiont of Amblyomma americanum]|uniref:preprotein translocase subunit SecG n=1 Tax=Coxiella endosymbiont of Amblyomma americanum TaxID=325775 RepID=UPI000581BC51|nr:preprotein translocase subunit SecG [Coxiella endosymbiont of Amblyomma americanum]AJC50267.1 preprotein translocase [Coxiella endosymbiont of Amblyomma americanum]AUJ58623.1 preprotein translocase subunit SecG [Coxiella-like endosymbiont of Amblyomma americanum]